MKVWITKCALTKGIIVADCDVDGAMARMQWRNVQDHFYGNEWHASHNDAVLRMADMLVAKRKYLEKQIAKLDKLMTTSWQKKVSSIEDVTR